MPAHGRTTVATEPALLRAVGDVLLMLAAFGVLAAVLAVIRNDPEKGRRKLATPPPERRLSPFPSPSQ